MVVFKKQKSPEAKSLPGLVKSVNRLRRYMSIVPELAAGQAPGIILWDVLLLRLT